MRKKNCAIDESAKDILNLLSDMAVVLDENGKLLLINDAFERTTGLNQKGAVGRSFFELINFSAESKKILLENLPKRIQGKSIKPYEISFIDVKGKKIFMEVKGKKVRYTGKLADLIVFQDITRSKKKSLHLRRYANEMEMLANRQVEEIKESEEKRRIISDITSDFVFSCFKTSQRVFTIDWMAGATEKVFGYSSSEIKEQGCWKFTVQPQDLPIFEKNITGLKPGKSSVSELRITRKDGSTLWIEALAHVEQNTNNPANCRLFGSCRDITERKKAEEALYQSESRYHSLFASSLDGVLLTKPDGTILSANPQACQMLGMNEGEIRKAGREGLVVKDKKMAKALREREQTGRTHAEFTFRRKNNTTFLGEISSNVFLDKAGVTKTCFIFRDITERKRLEKSLLSSEQKFRAISTCAKDGIVVVGVKGRIVYWNPAAEAIFGYSQKEAEGQNILNLLIPRRNHNFQQKFIQLFSNNKLAQEEILELTALRKDGREFPLELSANLIDFDGKSCVLGIVRDITERKKREVELHSTLEELHLALQSSKAGIWEWNLQTDDNVWSEETWRLYGLTPSSSRASYELWLETIHPDDRERAAQVVNEAVQNKAELFVEYRLSDHHGKGRWIMSRGQPHENEQGEVDHYLGVVVDITERKKIEDALKLENVKLETVTENVGAGLTIISNDYHILWANKVLRQIHGGDCEGKLCYSRFNKLADVCPNCGVKKVIENGIAIDSHEYTKINTKGEQIWVELIVTPIRDLNGNVIAALELSVDITERKLLQNKLQEYSEKLEQLVKEKTEQLRQTQTKLIKAEKFAAIGELAGMVGHDLRNPLAGIKNAAYYLRVKQESISKENKNKMLQVIDSAINHADKIITDLQDYSRELHLEIADCSPQSIMKEALTLVQIPEKVKIINSTLQEPLIRADETKMARVFINLIKNAIDAMHERGTLQIKSCQKDGNVEISFTDTGTGMSKDTMANLFVPLVTTKAQGMGFGLAICKRIMEAHQGRITVESVEGKGSTFILTLPIRPHISFCNEKEQN
jgi:PAS domain S-box-containing protein